MNDFEEAVTPRRELEALLASDEGRLGDVYRLGVEGLTPQEIAGTLNVASYAFVYNNRRIIDAILDGRPVEGRLFASKPCAHLPLLSNELADLCRRKQ